MSSSFDHAKLRQDDASYDIELNHACLTGSSTMWLITSFNKTKSALKKFNFEAEIRQIDY